MRDDQKKTEQVVKQRDEKIKQKNDASKGNKIHSETIRFKNADDIYK